MNGSEEKFYPNTASSYCRSLYNTRSKFIENDAWWTDLIKLATSIWTTFVTASNPTVLFFNHNCMLLNSCTDVWSETLRHLLTMLIYLAKFFKVAERKKVEQFLCRATSNDTEFSAGDNWHLLAMNNLQLLVFDSMGYLRSGLIYASIYYQGVWTVGSGD